MSVLQVVPDGALYRRVQIRLRVLPRDRSTMSSNIRWLDYVLFLRRQLLDQDKSQVSSCSTSSFISRSRALLFAAGVKVGQLLLRL